MMVWLIVVFLVVVSLVCSLTSSSKKNSVLYFPSDSKNQRRRCGLNLCEKKRQYLANWTQQWGVWVYSTNFVVVWYYDTWHFVSKWMRDQKCAQIPAVNSFRLMLFVATDDTLGNPHPPSNLFTSWPTSTPKAWNCSFSERPDPHTQHIKTQRLTVGSWFAKAFLISPQPQQPTQHHNHPRLKLSSQPKLNKVNNTTHTPTTHQPTQYPQLTLGKHNKRVLHSNTT